MSIKVMPSQGHAQHVKVMSRRPCPAYVKAMPAMNLILAAYDIHFGSRRLNSQLLYSSAGADLGGGGGVL